MKHTQKDYEKIIVIQEKVIKSLDATIKAKQEESNTLKKIIEKGWDRTDNYLNWIGYLKHLNQSYYANKHPFQYFLHQVHQMVSQQQKVFCLEHYSFFLKFYYT